MIVILYRYLLYIYTYCLCVYDTYVYDTYICIEIKYIFPKQLVCRVIHISIETDICGTAPDFGALQARGHVELTKENLHCFKIVNSGNPILGKNTLR